MRLLQDSGLSGLQVSLEGALRTAWGDHDEDSGQIKLPTPSVPSLEGEAGSRMTDERKLV